MSLELALQLKKKGRGPDTELVHMTKGEVAGLHRLARAVYGQRLPVNPETGLVEAGWLKSLLPTIVGGAVSYYTGSAGLGAAAGAATGAATNKGNRLEGAVAGGMAGYGGGQLGAALYEQGGIGSLANAEGWSNLLGNAAVKDPKTGAVTTKATGLGGWGGALQAGGLGIGVPLLLDMNSSGSKSDNRSASSIMQDPNAPASYRLKRTYLGGVKPPAATGESSERRWFDYTYEPTGLVKGGAEGGAVDNLPSSKKAYDYLHRRGKLDKPAGGDLTIDETPTDGVGTPPAATPPETRPESGGAPAQTVKEELAKTYDISPKVLAKMEKDGQAGRYYDPEKIKEALSKTAPGKDGRTVLKDKDWRGALLPIEGLKMIAAPTKWDAQIGMGEGGGNDILAGEDLGYYKDKYGQRFNVYQEKGDGNVYLKYWHPGKEGFRNVTGSDSDRITPTYRLDPKTGTAVPINPNSTYEASGWVDYGRDLAKMAAVMATVGVGGAALGAAQAAPAVAAGTSGAAGLTSAEAAALMGGTAGTTSGAAGLTAAEAAALMGTEAVAAGGTAAGTTAGTTAGSGIMGGLKTAGSYLSNPWVQKGLGAAATLAQGAGGAKAPKGNTGEQSEYVAPEGSGAYGGYNYFAKPPPPKKATGGVVPLRAGGFVFPADVVSQIGAGSSSAGLEILAKKFGAMPVSGKGHGQSDDVHALIDGTQPARVARDEAVLDAEQVAAIGGGDPKKGAKKLYALMKRVRKQSVGHTRQMRPVKLKELA